MTKTRTPKGVTPIQCSMSMGFTINMGNYESARIDVSMTTSVEDESVIDDAFVYLETYLSDKIQTLAKELEK